MLSILEFSKVVIIQSLGPKDPPTGQILQEYLFALNSEYQRDLSIELIDCPGAADFCRIMDDLIHEAKNGNYPILQIECHGGPQDGLEFRDDSDMGWDQVSEKITELNKATGLNLLVIFSACFGEYFGHTMSITKAAPCWCMLGPSKTIYADEILQCFREFYNSFFRDLDIRAAVNKLNKIKLSEGGWRCHQIEELFYTVCKMYLVEECTLQAGARRIDDWVKTHDTPEIRKLIEVEFRTKNHEKMHEYFHRYFMLDTHKEHRVRFGGSLASVQKLLEELKASGSYYL